MTLGKCKPIRLQKLRDSARGQPCTINSCVCNYNPETTVLAHYGAPGEKGMGTKPDDSSGAYACSDCHDYLDGRRMVPESEKALREWYWFRGMRRTWRLYIINGVLK